MTDQMVPKTFRGADGEEYVLDVPAPPPPPERTLRETAKRQVGRLPYFPSGGPMPNASDWNMPQANFLQSLVSNAMGNAAIATQLLHALAAHLNETVVPERFTIHSVPLALGPSKQAVLMPGGAVMLGVTVEQMNTAMLVFAAPVATTFTDRRSFLIAYAGNAVEEAIAYVGSFALSDMMTRHVFEVQP